MFFSLKAGRNLGKKGSRKNHLKSNKNSKVQDRETKKFSAILYDRDNRRKLLLTSRWFRYSTQFSGCCCSSIWTVTLEYTPFSTKSEDEALASNPKNRHKIRVVQIFVILVVLYTRHTPNGTRQSLKIFHIDLFARKSNSKLRMRPEKTS